MNYKFNNEIKSYIFNNFNNYKKFNNEKLLKIYDCFDNFIKNKKKYYIPNDKKILFINYYKFYDNLNFNIDNFLYVFEKITNILNNKYNELIKIKNKIFSTYLKNINDKDYDINKFIEIYKEIDKLYHNYKNHFKYFGIHGWNENYIKNRFSYLYNNVREKNKSNETSKYITTLPIIGEQILSHLKLFENYNSFYKFNNGINIPSLLFIPFDNSNLQYQQHYNIIQELINISYDNNGEYLVKISKIYLLRQLLNRGFSYEISKQIIDNNSEISKKILEQHGINLPKKEQYQLNLSIQRTCENIHNVKGNLVTDYYKENIFPPSKNNTLEIIAKDDITLEKVIFDDNGKILLLGSLSIMELYKRNKRFLIDPWILVGNNMGYISWNGMINKASINCILENNTNIFSSLTILEKNPSNLYFVDKYDTLIENINQYKYMGFFLIRFENDSEDFNLNLINSCPNKKNNVNDTYYFNKSKEKYYVMFVILDESSPFLKNRYILLNYKCNLIQWGNVADHRRYLLLELQQIMCMYSQKKINTYILLEKNNNSKQINDLCNTQYEDYLNNTNKKSNGDCIEAWYHKDIFNYLVKNNISLYSNTVDKDILIESLNDLNKNELKNKISNLDTIYILTSKYDLEEIKNKLNLKLNTTFDIKEIDGYNALEIGNKYYLFESYFIFNNDSLLKSERLLLKLGKMKEEYYDKYYKLMCIDNKCNEIINLDNLRNTKLFTYYHDKTKNKIYDVLDIMNQDYKKYELSKNNKDNIKYDLDIYHHKINNLKSLSICDIIKKYNGDKSKIDIDKEFSIIIIDNNKINILLEKLCYNMWNLLNKLYNPNRIVSILYNNNKYFNIGQVIPTYDNFKYVIENGNLRERTTLIFNIFYVCDFIWDIIILYNNKDKKYEDIKQYINEDNIKNKIKIIESKLGLTIKEIVNICKYNDKYSSLNNGVCDNFTQDRNQDSSICNIVTNLKQIVTTQKAIKPSYRIESNKKIFINIDDVYPPLSDKEKEYAINNNILIDNKLSWITGYKAWKANEKSFFYKLFTQYNKKFISGYSGSVNIILETGLMFNSKKEFLVLLCVGYMCHHKDHSIHEILFAAKSFDIDYKIDDNEYEYVDKLFKYIQIDMTENI